MPRVSAASVRPPALGVGITFSSPIEPLVQRRPDLVQVLEIEPQTTWRKTQDPAEPFRCDRDVLDHILRLPGHKLVHSIGTPVGGTVGPDPAQFRLLEETIRYCEAPWASDHLSFNQTPEFATGFFLPPRQTVAGINVVTAAIHSLQDALPVPLAVETGVNYLRPRADELPDGEFVARVVQGANCGLLLDLHNIFANGLNGRQPVTDYIEQLPLDQVWEVHVAGGMEMDGFWLDAHSGAIPDPLYAVCEDLIPRLPNLGAIIFEIFPSFVSQVGLRLIEEQLERVHALWALRREHGPPSPVGRASRRLIVDAPETAPPAAWERALGRLVTGQPANDECGAELANDRGVRLIEGLIHEFRASLIVGVLRLTSRLMMLALGPRAFRAILADYWSKVPPQMYGSLEADAFAEYLEHADLQIPHLAKILEFEQASAATLADDKVRVVHFDFEPLPLLRALAEGRLPDVSAKPGNFEIELTPDGPSGTGSLEFEEIQGAFPFH
jgi:uncharacterized protein (UPF0276 family)